MALGVTACNQRDRLTFPSSDGAGPETVIDFPGTDTTVTTAGNFVLVTGFSRDPDGVDTLYFELVGGVSNFPPIIDGSDSIRFGLPITTLNQSGQVIIIRVFGVDHFGNQGDTALRVLTVQ